MKYIVLKTSCLLAVRVEEAGDEMQILCFDRPSQLDDFLARNDASTHPLPVFRLDLERICRAAPPAVVQDGFFIRHKDALRKIPFHSILWLEAARNYTFLHLEDGKKVLVAHTLNTLRGMLPAAIFVTIHRSYMVNVHHVTGFAGNCVHIGRTSLPISKPFRRPLYGRFLFLDSPRHRTEPPAAPQRGEASETTETDAAALSAEER